MKSKKAFINCQCILTAFFLVTASFSNSLSAQSSSSPYSRYGLGDINNKVFGQGFALGGSSIAMQNDTTAQFFINTNNPASYSTNKLTTIELGLNYNRIRLESTSSNKVLNNAGFGYVALAVPLKKWWGASFGLIPYSSVGYKVADQQSISNVGNVNFLYEGSGGLSQAYLGTGFKPLYGLPKMFLSSSRYSRLKLEKKYAKINKILDRKRNLQSLSFGANMSYLFGNIDNSRTSIFNSGSTFNTRTGTTTRVGDFYFDYGMQYAHTIDSIRGRGLKENVKILFGVNFAAQTDINAKIDSLSYNYYSTSLGYNITKDTVEFVKDHRGKITLPLSFGAGIGFKKGDRWMVLADFAMQNWSSFQEFNRAGGLKNSMRFSVGTQYVPSAKATGLSNYMKRVHYRIGARYAETALELKNSQLTEFAVSAGIGLPVGRNYLLQNFSMVNIGVEAGQRGTTNNGLIKEQFFKATLSFTINDRWFVKAKYD